MEHHYPPNIERVEKEIEFHLEKNKDLSQIFEVYKGILAVQLDYLDKIKVSVTFTEEEIKEFFRKGSYLIGEQSLEVDPVLLRDVLISISKAIKEKSPEAPEALLTLSELDEFKEENVQKFLQKITAYDKQQLENYIQETGMDKRAGLDSEVISFVVFATISPFYSMYTNEVKKISDFTLWRMSYCPTCGQTATIAKHREEDGARVLECWLCHAQWYYPRVECPYCNNKDHKKLRFFYVPGDRSRQVHVCEVCKSYLKTIDSKGMEKDAILDLESIATAYLDVLAEREGYKLPGGDADSLN